jgi:hypothetical protein
MKNKLQIELAHKLLWKDWKKSKIQKRELKPKFKTNAKF